MRTVPTWKYTNTEVSDETVEKSLASLKGACFGCTTHSNDCPVYKAMTAVSEMKA